MWRLILARAAPAHVAVEDKGAVVHTHTLAVKRDIGQAQMVMAPPCGEGLLRFGIACRGNEGDVAGQAPRRLECVHGCREDASRARAAASCPENGGERETKQLPINTPLLYTAVAIISSRGIRIFQESH
jgi:hypothetical protein